MARPIGVCAFCGKTAELQESHILPANRQRIANPGGSFLRHRITPLNVSWSRHVQRRLVAVAANTAGRERCGQMAPEGGDRAA